MLFFFLYWGACVWSRGCDRSPSGREASWIRVKGAQTAERMQEGTFQWTRLCSFNEQGSRSGALFIKTSFLVFFQWSVSFFLPFFSACVYTWKLAWLLPLLKAAKLYAVTFFFLKIFIKQLIARFQLISLLTCLEEKCNCSPELWHKFLVWQCK